MLAKFLKRAAARAGIAVYKAQDRYNQDGLFTVHSQSWRHSPEFRASYARSVEASRGIDPGLEWRVHIALWAARTALATPGDFVECGVNAGFISSAILHRLCWNGVGRKFYLIDTFRGPVFEQFSSEEIKGGRFAAAEAGLISGAYVTDVDRVRANFSEWPNAVVVEGAVPEILKSIDFGEVAFAHIDMNCAAADAAAFEFFWDRLSPHGVILFDDYGYSGHDSQRRAIDAVAERTRVEILSLPTGQGLIIKGREPADRVRC